MHILLLVIVLTWLIIILIHARSLYALWQEPVLKQPVMILESDDWGAGPEVQAEMLNAIINVLISMKNSHGEHPVMTLGLVLEVPDKNAMNTTGEYKAIRLVDDGQTQVMRTIRGGMEAGIFAPQLHGQCHYWPHTLVIMSDHDQGVRDWLGKPGIGWTEELPDPLQSRWIDCSVLPSIDHDTDKVKRAVRDEHAAWNALFGNSPCVVVPTTFIWNDDVEKALDEVGVRYLVTPGARHRGRDENGLPMPPDKYILNGEKGCGQLRYLVRDVYFEPVLGHDAERMRNEVRKRFSLGRPALVEIHRFNFCGPGSMPGSLMILQEALQLVIERIPSIRFMSTEALAKLLESRDPDWVESDFEKRFSVWLDRIYMLRRFGRLMKLSGLLFPLLLMRKVLA